MLLIILRISLQLIDMCRNKRLLKYLFAIIRQPLWKQTKWRWMNEIKSSDNENNPLSMMNHELFLQKDWSTKGIKPFFEPRPLSQNLSLGFVDWICAVLLTILAINFFTKITYFLSLDILRNFQVRARIHLMRCAIWYHLHNLKNVKNTHGGVLLLVMLQAKCRLTLFLCDD